MTLAAAVAAPQTPASTSWADTFVQFSGLHFITVGILVGAILTSIALGRRWHQTERERKLSLYWGVWILVSMTAGGVWFCLPGNFKWSFSLPLHICDLVAVMAGIAILFPWRWPKTVCVFWGLALCTQAFITPIVPAGYLHVHFWYFWLSHTYAVGTAIYLVAVRGYRATGTDYLVASATLASYIGFILPADIAFGWNYGFVGNDEPGMKTVVQSLGGWPIRIYWMGAIAFSVMAAVWGLIGLYHRWHDRSLRADAAKTQ